MLDFDRAGLKDLENSGLQRISAGAESGSPKILRYVKKPHTVPMLLEANKLWSGSNIYVFYSWMSGLPGETREDLKKTVKVMFRIMRDNPNARLSPIYNFLPFPGTSMWSEVIENHGFKPPEKLQEWGNYDWSHVNVSYLDPASETHSGQFVFPQPLPGQEVRGFSGPLVAPMGRKAIPARGQGQNENPVRRASRGKRPQRPLRKNCWLQAPA